MKTALIQAAVTAAQQIHGDDAEVLSSSTTFNHLRDGEIRFLIEANYRWYVWCITIDGDHRELVIKTDDHGPSTKHVVFQETSEIKHLMKLANEYLKSLV